MSEIARVELPSLIAQSDQAARTGMARAAATETVRREEDDYRLELLSRQRSEEVQEAERVQRSGEHPRERGDGREPGRRHEHGPEDPDGEQDHPHIDVTA